MPEPVHPERVKVDLCMRPGAKVSAIVFCWGLACARKPPDTTPEGAVRDFLDRIEHIEINPSQAQAAYDLLSSRTRANLIERAKRASAATGREVLPQEMLAPGRFSLRFQPVRMHTRISSDKAVVDVAGIDPDTDHATVPCILEAGRWRIEVPLPLVMPVERRPEP